MPPKKKTDAAPATGAKEKGSTTPASKVQSGEEEPCRLLSLAAELRNRIWEYALIEPDAVQMGPNLDIRPPGLLSTCHQIRSETLQLYYRMNVFDITITDCDGCLCDRFSRHMQDINVDDKKVSVTILTVGIPNWSSLLEWCHIVHAGRNWALPSHPDDNAFDAVIVGALRIAKSARELRDWPTCLKTLQAFRVVAGHVDKRWLLD